MEDLHIYFPKVIQIKWSLLLPYTQFESHWELMKTKGINLLLNLPANLEFSMLRKT